jgi:hypothetical protein
MIGMIFVATEFWHQVNSMPSIRFFSVLHVQME